MANTSVIWGPGGTALVLPPNGLIGVNGAKVAAASNLSYTPSGNMTSTDVQSAINELANAADKNPIAQSSQFDDFCWGNLIQANVPVGPMGIVSGANAGGSGNNLVNTPQEAGRPGIISHTTGTSSNATGQGFFYMDTCLLYPGDGTTTTLQWAAKTPTPLSDVTNEYVMEGGWGAFTAAANPVNAMMIQYKRTASTNWTAYTSNNSTQTLITTVDSSNFVVAAATWYNFKIVYAAGTVSFYVGKVGSPFVLLGTSITNLPDSTHATSLYWTIYRASTFALKRDVKYDWAKWDTVITTR